MSDDIPSAVDDRVEHVLASIREEMAYLKYLVTLSTGSILVLATFLEKIFRAPVWKGLVVVSFGAFMVSIFAALIAYTALIQAFQERQASDKWSHALWVAVPALCSMFGFALGLTCFTIFSLRNFLAQ